MELLEFILMAKKSGYATGGENGELLDENGSKGFEFRATSFRYVDRYFGFNPFSGTESVYDKQDSLIWVMNYYGEVLDTCESPQLVYETLKLAMQKIDEACPFRGPPSFEHSGLVYRNRQSGCLSSFDGYESISKNGNEIYSLHYHGGSLKQHT